jgi:hypothetical protein
MTVVAPAVERRVAYDLHVRGEIPSALSGSLLVACSRRHKDRRVFSRWHDSQADIMRIDLEPGRPGRARAHVLEVDPSGAALGAAFCPSLFEQEAYGRLSAYGYATQPNHAVNVGGDSLWATNLLFGAPLEIDIATLSPRRILRVIEPHEAAPRLSSTSHFAWSLDRRRIYFHQSLVEETASGPARFTGLKLVEVEVTSGSTHAWDLLPPDDDNVPEAANFHSAFYFEENGRRFVGLLRTGAVVTRLAPGDGREDRPVFAMPPSTIWIVEVVNVPGPLKAELLPGIRELGLLALSHLNVDATGGDGFTLYANSKHAAVGEETRGANIYGESPEAVTEHYAGMIIEPMNHGSVIRYERRNGATSVRTFSRAYDPGRTSRGHTWLPINIEVDASRRFLYCTFAGFRPRLLPSHVAAAYAASVVDPHTVRFIPPVLMRLDAATLEPDDGAARRALTYAEPTPTAVVGEADSGYVCTFSPEAGLRIFDSGDLRRMIASAVSGHLMNHQDTHFRPEPAHLQFVPR